MERRKGHAQRFLHCWRRSGSALRSRLLRPAVARSMQGDSQLPTFFPSVLVGVGVGYLLARPTR